MKIPRTKLYITNKAMIEALFKLFHKSSLEKGAAVSKFEEDFGKFHGKGIHAVAMPFARIAFYFLLKALNLPKGSRVLMSPLTIADMVNMVRCAGLIPEFVDIRTRTFDVDPIQLQKAIKPNTSVLLVTHLFGISSEMDTIVDIAKKNNLFLIEDFSQNLGGKYKGKSLGTFGNAGICSLSSLKNCSTFYGGMLVSKDIGLINTIRKNICSLPQPEIKVLFPIIFKSLIFSAALSPLLFSGITYFMVLFLENYFPGIMKKIQSDNRDACLRDDVPSSFLFGYTNMQAEIGSRLLNLVPEGNKKRREHAQLLTEILKDSVPLDALPKSHTESEDIYWRYPLLVENPRPFQRYLMKHGVDNSATNLVLCTNQDYFFPYKAKMPISERVKEDLVFIPIEHQLSDREIKKIGVVIRDYFYKKNKDYV